SSSWSCCLSTLRSGFAGVPGAGTTDGDGAWLAGGCAEESWGNAGRVAPSAKGNPKAYPTTKRGSVRLPRRRIIAFKGRPKPLKDKPLKGQPSKARQSRPGKTGIRRG